MILEVPCGNIESVEAAVKGGADRIELCSSLSLGGLTPTIGMLEAISNLPVTKFVMIRPREGDFVFSQKEFSSMLRDIGHFQRAGAHGIVSGILFSNGTIDFDRSAELLEASRPLPFTFHRAFDLTPDAFRALDMLIKMKVDYLLTSGQAADASAGRELISKLVHLAGENIKIIAGGGINPENVASVCDYTHVNDVHLSGRIKRKIVRSNHTPVVSMGNMNDDDMYEVADSYIIGQVRKIIDKAK